MIKEYIEESFSFLNEDLIQKLANTSVEELDMQELENMIPSPSQKMNKNGLMKRWNII